jgi:NADP-dependent 3-hydroxy acid dehydrogenase YdfG
MAAQLTRGGDPVMLITGAGSGIGAAAARALAGRRRLVLAGRRPGPLRELSAELGGEEQALAVACDVTEWEQVERAVAAGLSRYGRLDGVLANAGFGIETGFLEDTPERWRALILTHLYGVAITIRAALPHLLERGAGDVLITTSTAGRRTLPGSLYSATKSAATALAEALRLELRQIHGNDAIRVTVIAPGRVQTPFRETPTAMATLAAEDVAAALAFALGQPPGVEIGEILLRPTGQPL